MESIDASINAQFKRGILIPAKTRSKFMCKSKCRIERVFFVLDTQTGAIHLFKNLEQDKPSESFSLAGGIFPEKLSK